MGDPVPACTPAADVPVLRLQGEQPTSHPGKSGCFARGSRPVFRTKGGIALGEPPALGTWGCWSASVRKLSERTLQTARVGTCPTEESEDERLSEATVHTKQPFFLAMPAGGTCANQPVVRMCANQPAGRVQTQAVLCKGGTRSSVPVSKSQKLRSGGAPDDPSRTPRLLSENLHAPLILSSVTVSAGEECHFI